MSESPAKVQPSPVLRQKSVQSGGYMPRTFGPSDSDNGPGSLALDLIAAGVTAKLAREIGARRLAIAAARRTRVLADGLVISLSPMLAATSAEAEEDRLDGVRCNADLVALLQPEPDEEDDQ